MRNDTNVFHDKWIPRESNFTVITHNPYVSSEMKVNELITGSGQWCMTSLRDSLWEVDINSIVSITICKSRLPYQWIWHYFKDGNFSTRSAYKLYISDLSRGECSSGEDMLCWWKNLWKLNIPSKIRIIIWRLFHEILPTNLNLCRRNIHIYPWCQICKKGRRISLPYLLWMQSCQIDVGSRSPQFGRLLLMVVLCRSY